MHVISQRICLIEGHFGGTIDCEKSNFKRYKVFLSKIINLIDGEKLWKFEDSDYQVVILSKNETVVDVAKKFELHV